MSYPKLKENKCSKQFIDLYLSMRSEIMKRCEEIAKFYYRAKIWTKENDYITNFIIEDDKIYIYGGPKDSYLVEFDLEDFFDNEKLEEAILDELNFDD